MELRATRCEISTRVLRAHDAVTDRQVLRAIAEVGLPLEEKNVLGVMVSVLWHETYHMGQIGTIPTQLGLTPTIDRAIEACEHAD